MCRLEASRGSRPDLKHQTLMRATPPPKPPPSPPPPPPPPSLPSTEQVLIEFVAAGELSDFTPAIQEAFQKAIALAASKYTPFPIDWRAVHLKLTAGSVVILATIYVPGSVTVAAVEAGLAESFTWVVIERLRSSKLVLKTAAVTDPSEVTTHLSIAALATHINRDLSEGALQSGSAGAGAARGNAVCGEQAHPRAGPRHACCRLHRKILGTEGPWEKSPTVLRERGEIFSRSRAPDGGRAVALCRP